MKTHIFTMVSSGAVLLMVILGAGCQGQQQRTAFCHGIHQSIDAVQGGDLQGARVHLREARGNAKSFEDRRLVNSVDGLISGTEYLMDGRIEEAKRTWSRIEDPQLNREVRVKASALMGLDVPVLSAGKGEEQ